MAKKPIVQRSSTSARAKAPAARTKPKASSKPTSAKIVQRLVKKAGVKKAGVKKAGVKKAGVKKAGAAPTKPAKSKGERSPAAAAKSANSKKAVKPAAESQRGQKSATKASANGKRRSSGPKPGDKAPAFELMDQNGKTVSSRALAGKPYVLYFYPRDNTPGCTTEACAFRDSHPDFSKLGVRVFGVSADSVKSHMGFAEKYQLPFTLLADPEKQLIAAYGSWVLKQNYGREYMGIERSTFLIDKQGKVAHGWRGVKVNGHADAVLEQARKLG